MNQKNIAIAAVLAASLLAGVFAATLPVVYAEENGGDSSETETEQTLKQKNVGSGESTNINCGTNNLEAVASVTACPTVSILSEAAAE